MLVNARLAADAVGATKMDRPEWCAVQPGQRRDLLHADQQPRPRRVGTTSGNNVPTRTSTPANPRYWLDDSAAHDAASAARATSTATSCACAKAATTPRPRPSPGTSTCSARRPSRRRLTTSTTVERQPVGPATRTSPSPDGCWFSPPDRHLLDPDRRRRLHRRHQLHDAGGVPGQFGDGGQTTLVTKADGSTGARCTDRTSASQADDDDTTSGASWSAPRTARSPASTETPDGKALFVNIQHPGENTAAANIATRQVREPLAGHDAGIDAPTAPAARRPGRARRP